MKHRAALLTLLIVSACAPHRTISVSPVPLWSFEPASSAEREVYRRVTPEAAALLGCEAAPASPVCEIAPPTAEEYSAFLAEADRLSRHRIARCRDLGAAIEAHQSGVMMYRNALIRSSAGLRYYGVGHTYELGDTWAVRVARRIDDLNERTLDEKLRTLRHEVSHTIGASEKGSGWTAENYASRCG